MEPFKEKLAAQHIHHVLVIGGAGFIGSHTVNALLNADCEVTVLDNLASGKISNLDLTNQKLHFIEGDVLELPFVMELVAQVDAVIYLAAMPSVAASIENPIYAMQVNTQGLIHVLQALRNVNPVIPLIYASSAAVYGDAKDLPCEESAVRGTALSPYSLQKLHCEDYAALFHRLFGIRSIGLRYFNVYGLNQDPASPYSGVITRFLSAMKAGEPLTVFGDGSQSRDFVAVDDIAIANLAALTLDYTGVINVATGMPQTLLTLIATLEDIGQQKAEIHYAPARVGDIHVSYGSTAKATDLLNFRATVTLREGLRNLW